MTKALGCHYVTIPSYCLYSSHMLGFMLIIILHSNYYFPSTNLNSVKIVYFRGMIIAGIKCASKFSEKSVVSQGS